MSQDLSITSTGNGTLNLTPRPTAPNVAYADGGTADAHVTTAQLEGLTGDIGLQAQRDLFQDAPLTLTAPGQGLTLEAGGTITIAGAASLQFDGNITFVAAAAGSPTPDAAGAIALSGLVTSTSGGVSLSAGTGGLDVSGGVTTATGLTIDTAGNASVSGVVAGDGGLTQAGAGTTTLSANNSYTGATTITAGTLALSGDGASVASSSVVDVAAGAVFDLSDADTSSPIPSASVTALSGSGTVQLGKSMSGKGVNLSLTGSGTNIFAGEIVGVGGLSQDGSGTQILTGENTYTGGTTISSGTLQLGNGGATGSIASTSTISFGSPFAGGPVPTPAPGGPTLAVDRSDAITLSQQITGAGTVVQTGTGTLTLSNGTNTYSGGTTIESGTLTLAAAGAAGTGAITFPTLTGTATARLTLELSAQPTNATFANTISNFGVGSQLELVGLQQTLVSYNSETSFLTVTGKIDGTDVTQTYRFENPTATDFSAQDNGNGNTVIVACYVTGTLIRTMDGDVPVEHLAIGDHVVTASGAHRPIKWIGTRSYAGRFIRNSPELLPIRFTAGSLADGVPTRDLLVSPKHAMVLDDCLIPAEHLVNGATIARVERVETLTYWHIELDSHDVLIAEGAESESFVDDDSRGMFHNAHTFAALYPSELRRAARYCLPRLEHGFVLEAIRRRLSERAGLAARRAETFGQLRGALEISEADAQGAVTVSGWAQDLAYPDAPVCLDVLVDGVCVALVYADRYCPELARVGIGDGCHAFDVALPAPAEGLGFDRVTVRRAADGAAIPARATAGAGRRAA